jgi:2'-5' RNA ligase
MKSKDKAQLSLFEQAEEFAPEPKEKYHYLFVVSPSNEIKEKVNKVKEQLKKIIPEASLALRSTPHISVTGFQTSKKLDDATFEKLNQLFSKTPRFAVSFNGFQNFLHGQISNTLYLTIEDEKPFIELNKIFVKFFNLSERNFKPHLTVAKTLPRECLPKIEQFMEQENFQAKFMCTNITVLESTFNQNKMSAYKVFKTIALQKN